MVHVVPSSSFTAVVLLQAAVSARDRDHARVPNLMGDWDDLCMA